MHKAVILVVVGAQTCLPPPDDNPGALPLDAPITMDVGAFDPTSGTCSTPTVPNRVPMHVRQPSGTDTYPVFLFLPGTGRDADNPTAIALIERAAGRGFVAASAEYASLSNHLSPPEPCYNYDGKASCTFQVDAPEAPEAALNLLCNDLTVTGAAAGLRVDCSKGIVVAGFSQGGGLAMLAQDHHAGVDAAWVISFHDQTLIDPVPLECLHHDERSLPQDALRLILGEDDWVLRTPHQPHLEDVTGRSCPTNTETCFDADDSGWGRVRNSECASGSCGHEYLDDNAFWGNAWWGANTNLDWLQGQLTP